MVMMNEQQNKIIVLRFLIFFTLILFLSYFFSYLGYYIYFETSYATVNETATVQKNFTANGAASCLQFWYHMYGRHVNTLNVYTLQNRSKELIWTRSFNQLNNWYKADATVKITQGEYTVSSYKLFSRSLNSYCILYVHVLFEYLHLLTK